VANVGWAKRLPDRRFALSECRLRRRAHAASGFDGNQHRVGFLALLLGIAIGESREQSLATLVSEEGAALRTPWAGAWQVLLEGELERRQATNPMQRP
jgi:hypothetical protein